MKESDLANPVMEWLRARGLTPYGEIGWGGRAIDVVGLSDTEVWAVELKLGLTQKVIYQAMINQVTAHRSWCAVASKPRCWEKRLPEGVGLLVIESETVRVFREAVFCPKIINRHRLGQIRGTCAYKTPGGKAGLPTMRGIGVAQRVYDAVQGYVVANPSASWAEIFKVVPNHYAHPRSMQGAMRMVRDVRAARAKRLSGVVS